MVNRVYASVRGLGGVEKGQTIPPSVRPSCTAHWSHILQIRISRRFELFNEGAAQSRGNSSSRITDAEHTYRHEYIPKKDNPERRPPTKRVCMCRQQPINEMMAASRVCVCVCVLSRSLPKGPCGNWNICVTKETTIYIYTHSVSSIL